MTAVGQDEVVILLVKEPEEDLPPKDIFMHLQRLYEQAGRGGHVGDMGHTIIEIGDQFLGSNDFGGFLYFRHSFQVLFVYKHIYVLELLKKNMFNFSIGASFIVSPRMHF